MEAFLLLNSNELIQLNDESGSLALNGSPSPIASTTHLIDPVDFFFVGQEDERSGRTQSKAS